MSTTKAKIITLDRPMDKAHKKGVARIITKATIQFEKKHITHFLPYNLHKHFMYSTDQVRISMIKSTEVNKLCLIQVCSNAI